MTLSLSALSGRLKVEPKTLRTAAAATQQWNEYVKALAGDYNSCAITKQQYQEGLMRIYPRLEKDAIELEKLRQLVMNQKQIDKKRMQKVLKSYESQLRAFAKVSGKEIDYERIETLVEKHLQPVSAKVDLVTRQQVDLQKQFEELKRRVAELPTPKQVESEIRTRLLAKMGEAEAAYNQGYEFAQRFRFSGAIPTSSKHLPSSSCRISTFLLCAGKRIFIAARS